jgi:hypothetical protein
MRPLTYATQKTAVEFRCIVCNNILVVADNWYAASRATSNYKCKLCQKAASTKRLRDNPDASTRWKKANPNYHRDYARREAIRKREWQRDNPERVMLTGAKIRARRHNVPCTIVEHDIVIPLCCPILGITLALNHDGKSSTIYSPSLDRRIPALGYVPGNIAVISSAANSLKGRKSANDIWEAARAQPYRQDLIRLAIWMSYSL